MFGNFYDKLKTMLAALSDFALAELLPALVILVVGILAVRGILAAIDKILRRTKLEKVAHTFIRSLARIVLYLLLGLIVASSLGIDVTGIIALASVLTLAISLSIQNILANVFGGLTLLYTRPFSSGDYVDAAGKSGTVQQIGMTYTVLLTPDNKQISIPNSSVIAGDITNYTVTGTRRLDVPVHAAYSVPTQKVIDALIQAGTVDNVLLSPAPCAIVDSYGDTTVNYILRVWTKTEDYWDVNFLITEKIKSVFDAQDIPMIFPQMHVHIEK